VGKLNIILSIFEGQFDDAILSSLVLHIHSKKTLIIANVWADVRFMML